ncbi:hypothetical protein GOV05_02505 [Candidatus Woesearchaeota archaeon]|nr:hypothetical protein [Candidatus Woesearchaeota archaeon]
MSEKEEKEFTYKDAGVDIELGDEVSEILYNAAKETWKNREGKLGELIVPFDDFSGARAIDVSGLPKGTLMNLGFDGVGTKMEVAERIEQHDTVAYDLFAMVCDDAVVRGAEPVIIGSILDVNSLSNKKDEPFLEEVRQLANGYINAAREAGVAVVNGEVAELGARVNGYGDFNYNWGAGLVWFANKNRMFKGDEIKPGHFLVGLKEEGFRSNGLSLVRRVLENTHGPEWHLDELDGEKLGELVLKPSRIYSKAIIDMIGGYNPKQKPKVNISGVAHITGGGIPGKLGRILKPGGLSAEIHTHFEPPKIMRYVQELGNVSDEEAYKTWNMGQGMIIVTSQPTEVMHFASEHGIESKLMGKIDSEFSMELQSDYKPHITIFGKEKLLHYDI